MTEDMLYSYRSHYFNNEAHGMRCGEFANYTDYFAQAPLSGADCSPDLGEGVETFCAMEAVKRSAQTRQPVQIALLLAEIGLQRR